jgi:hypothetical protein
MPLINQDSIDLLKQDGATVAGIRATVASSDLIVFSAKQQGIAELVRVDPNDLLVRKTSVGEETYQVIDPVFYEQGLGPRGAHYQCKVKKLGLPEATAAIQHITYNVSGPNARVNVNSTDNSTNIANIDSQVDQHIGDLREAINTSGLNAEQMREALEIVDAVKAQFEAGKPKRSVVMAMLSAIPAVGKIAAAITALISIL